MPDILPIVHYPHRSPVLEPLLVFPSLGWHPSQEFLNHQHYSAPLHLRITCTADHIHNPLEVIFSLVLMIVSAIDSCSVGKNLRQVTIEVLPDDILLEIFDSYRLDAVSSSRGRPWKWHRLAHICRRWRHIIHMSPQRLGLRILCKSGKPIERVLRAWPTLPLVVGFKGSPKSKSLPENVVIALKHTDRVCEIDLGVTTPISQSIADMMQVQFPALEHIRIASKDAAEPLVIGEFLGGLAPHLKKIHVGGIAIPFPALRRLLLSTNNLVDLILENIPKSCYFSPDALVTILSSLDYLQELHIRFRPPASRLNTNTESPPPLGRSTCPSLIVLYFYGASEYLEAFVARTHMPALFNLTIRFFNQVVFEIPQLNGFISRVENLKFINHIYILPTEKYVEVAFHQLDKRGHNRGECHLSIPCRQLDWQLSFATQILDQLPDAISSARLLVFYKLGLMSAGREDVDPAQWLEIFQGLPHLWEVRVEREELVPDIVHALVNEDIAAGVLPGLIKLHLEGYRKSPSTIIDTVERFVATRKLTSRNIFLSG